MFKLNLEKVIPLERLHKEWGVEFITDKVNRLTPTFSFQAEVNFYGNLLSNYSKSPEESLLFHILVGKPAKLRWALKQIAPIFRDAMTLKNESFSDNQKIINFRAKYGHQTLQGVNLINIADFKNTIDSLLERIEKIFRYQTLVDRRKECHLPLEDFNSLTKKNWSAYQLTYHLGNRVCCFCNGSV